MTATTQQLLDRIDELEEEVRQLREAMQPVIAPPTKLTPTEYRLFSLLHVDRIVSKDAIFHAVFDGRILEDSNVQVTIYKLRRKIERFGYVIHTHRSVGYSMDLPPVS